jgi:hypothetical protein
METKNLIGLGLVAVGGYFLYTYMKNKKDDELSELSLPPEPTEPTETIATVTEKKVTDLNLADFGKRWSADNLIQLKSNPDIFLNAPEDIRIANEETYRLYAQNVGGFASTTPTPTPTPTPKPDYDYERDYAGYGGGSEYYADKDILTGGYIAGSGRAKVAGLTDGYAPY